MHSPCLMQTSLLSDLGTAMTSADSSASPTFLIVYNAASGLSVPPVPLLQTLCVACARHPLCGVKYQTDSVLCVPDRLRMLFVPDRLCVLFVPDRLHVVCTRQTLCVVCTRQTSLCVPDRLYMLFVPDRLYVLFIPNRVCVVSFSYVVFIVSVSFLSAPRSVILAMGQTPWFQPSWVAYIFFSGVRATAYTIGLIRKGEIGNHICELCIYVYIGMAVSCLSTRHGSCQPKMDLHVDA